MSDSLQVVLGFDMETDIGSWTPWYEGFGSGTSVILEVLEQNDVTGTFFFTGDAARKNPDSVSAAFQAGHEVGCHTLFHETIGDSLFDIPGMMPILPEEVPHRLELATDWVEEVAGVRPVSFRAPRLFGSTAMVNALNDLGYLADATYPMYYFREQLRPYRPDRSDWTRQGDLAIVELPNFADPPMESTDPGGRALAQWPLSRPESAEAVLEHIDGYCEYCDTRGVEPFLCFYFHPWEFAVMPEGDLQYGEGSVRPDPFIVKNTGPYAAEQFNIVVHALKDRGGEFLQAREVAERMNA